MCLAVLKLAAERGWNGVTLDLVAKAAKVSLAHIKKNFKTANDLLPVIVRYVTDEVASAIGKPDRKASPHDQLFDVMMARFDVLQKHRAGILAITKAMRRDPAMFCILIPAQRQEMRRMLDLAGIEQVGPVRLAAPAGLWVIYMVTLRIWQGDETIDMAKTMAGLDRALRFTGRAAEILFPAFSGT